MTPFKGRWNKHRNDWKKHWNTKNIDDENDLAALLKTYISVHSDALNVFKKLVLHRRLLFLKNLLPTF